MSEVRKITQADLKDFALGAAMLGSGGGGDPYLGRLLAQQALLKNPHMELLQVNELADDAIVTIAAFVGAPTVFCEKITINDLCLQPLQQLEELAQQKISALMPVEIGGINSLIPIPAAVNLGLPIVDVDMMGRAFPQLSMMSASIYDVEIGPCIFTNEQGESKIIECSDMHQLEKEARTFAVAMGGSCFAFMGTLSKRTLQRIGVLNTITLAIELGASIRKAKTSNQDPIKNLESFFERSIYGKSKIIFDGKIVDLLRRDEGGFTKGHLCIDSLTNDDVMEVVFQNETLRAKLNGKTVAIVPDLICILDRETAKPITVESLRFGQRVKVLAIRAPEIKS